MQKIVVAVTGASGSVYANLLLKNLVPLVGSQVQEIAVVMSTNAKTVWQTEIGDDSFKNFPVKFYEPNDFNAPFASGSAKFGTMFIVPCSAGTLGRIANGISNDLVTRAADVILKERRKLICCLRETPYNLIHIRNMEAVTLAGGIICPATPSFYSLPKSIDELAMTVVHRMMQLAGLDIASYSWGE